MVYIVTDWSGAVKIGVTQQLKTRLVSLQTGNPRKIDVLMTFETESLKLDKKLEKILHSEFIKQKIVFENGIETEWFDDSVLNVIGKNTSWFLAHLRKKYCFNSDVKSSVGVSLSEVESRRISNLKNVICDSDIYKGIKLVPGKLVDNHIKESIDKIDEDVSNDRYILCTSKIETQAVLNNLGNDGYKWPSGCLAFNYNPYTSTIYKAIYIICKEDKCLHWENAIGDVAKGSRTVKASDYLSGSV